MTTKLILVVIVLVLLFWPDQPVEVASTKPVIHTEYVTKEVEVIKEVSSTSELTELRAKIEEQEKLIGLLKDEVAFYKTPKAVQPVVKYTQPVTTYSQCGPNGCGPQSYSTGRRGLFGRK